MCGRGGLEHPHAPAASCSGKAGGARGAGAAGGAAWGCLAAPHVVTDSGGHWAASMGRSEGSGSGGSSTLPLCTSCCFSLFTHASGEGDTGGGRVGVSSLLPAWGWGCRCFWQLLCKPQDPRGPVVDTVSPISADIGPRLGGMIISSIRSSTDRALGSLQSLLQGSGPIPGGLAGPRRGLGEGHAGLTAGVGARLGEAPGEGGPSGLAVAAWGKCWDCGGCPYVAFFDGSPRLSWVRTNPHPTDRMRLRAPRCLPRDGDAGGRLRQHRRRSLARRGAAEQLQRAAGQPAGRPQPEPAALRPALRQRVPGCPRLQRQLQRGEEGQGAGRGVPAAPSPARSPRALPCRSPVWSGS